VLAQSREMTSELFARFMNDLTNNHIAELVHSQVVHERIGGIMAVGSVTSSSSLVCVDL
jgi:hypothetical protein